MSFRGSGVWCTAQFSGRPGAERLAGALYGGTVKVDKSERTRRLACVPASAVVFGGGVKEGERAVVDGASLMPRR